VIESFLAWLFLGNEDIFGIYGFRFLLLSSSIPTFITLIFWPFLSESPRYYFVSNESNEYSLQVLKRISWYNRRELPAGTLLENKIQSNRGFNIFNKGSIFQLFSKNYYKLTILCVIIWCSNSFTYYGIVQITPLYFKTQGNFLPFIKDRTKFISIHLLPVWQVPFH
jgi:hypothetical protein